MQCMCHETLKTSHHVPRPRNMRVLQPHTWFAYRYCDATQAAQRNRVHSTYMYYASHTSHNITLSGILLDGETLTRSRWHAPGGCQRTPPPAVACFPCIISHLPSRDLAMELSGHAPVPARSWFSALHRRRLQMTAARRSMRPCST